MRRIVIALALVILASAALASGRPAAAQAPPLSDLALADFDLPGFSQLTEQTPVPPQGVSAIYSRTFAGPEEDQSVLYDSLIQPSAPVSAAVIGPLIASGSPLETLRDNSGSAVANYQLNGPLGIGEVDQSAVWDSYSGNGWFRWYADIFLRNGLVAIIAYAAPSGVGDPNAIATYAGVQDAKLMAVGQ
jgi:hypothetical protein